MADERIPDFSGGKFNPATAQAVDQTIVFDKSGNVTQYGNLSQFGEAIMRAAEDGSVGPLKYNGSRVAATVPVTVAGNLTVTGGNITGNGSGITNVPATGITGTFATLNVAGNAAVGHILGNGSNLDHIPAGNITGLIPDASIPANIARRDVDTTFSANLTIGGIISGDAGGLSNLPASGPASPYLSYVFINLSSAPVPAPGQIWIDGSDMVINPANSDDTNLIAKLFRFGTLIRLYNGTNKYDFTINVIGAVDGDGYHFTIENATTNNITTLDAVTISWQSKDVSGTGGFGIRYLWGDATTAPFGCANYDGGTNSVYVCKGNADAIDMTNILTQILRPGYMLRLGGAAGGLSVMGFIGSVSDSGAYYTVVLSDASYSYGINTQNDEWFILSSYPAIPVDTDTVSGPVIKLNWTNIAPSDGEVFFDGAGNYLYVSKVSREGFDLTPLLTAALKTYSFVRLSTSGDFSLYGRIVTTDIQSTYIVYTLDNYLTIGTVNPSDVVNLGVFIGDMASFDGGAIQSDTFGSLAVSRLVLNPSTASDAGNNTLYKDNTTGRFHQKDVDGNPETVPTGGEAFRAWASFSASGGTVVAGANWGMTNVTRNDIGDFTATFDIERPDTNFGVIVTTTQSDDGFPTIAVEYSRATYAVSFKVYAFVPTDVGVVDGVGTVNVPVLTRVDTAGVFVGIMTR